MTTDEKLNVFLIDDDDIEAEEVERSLGKVRMHSNFFRARDGIEALQMLRGENGHEKIPKPILAMVDLRMPRMDGIEFLDELWSDKELNSTIAFVLTTSDSQTDMTKAYARNVAGYIVKSAAIDEYALKIQTIVGSFRRSVEFPPVSA